MLDPIELSQVRKLIMQYGCLTGMVSPWTSNEEPEGWLVCDGREISRETYADLFSIIGTSCGVGDGSTTFNIPNLKGKGIMGLDASQTEFNTIGKTGGEKSHVLTVTEMPQHKHGTAMRAASDTNNNINNLMCYGGTTAAYTTDVGGNAAHNNLGPYTVFNWIIKC